MKKPFYPKMLPINMNDSDLLCLYKKALEASKKLAEFSTLLERNFISDKLISLFALNESVQSTRIEGTQATFTSVVEAQASEKIDKDTVEVLNYLEALNIGVDLLNSLPISTRMILKLHEIILKGARGKDRSPRAYRKIQNWIGPTSRIEDATYIPPSADKVDEYILNLEKYINDEIVEDIDPIIKIAVIHAQFETIHPFLDGNGRIGRILIILYLLSKNVISKPTFFVSQELEKNKFKYYTMLNNLRNENPKWKEWILFFLEAVIQQANKNIEKLRKIDFLYNELKEFSNANNIKINFVEYIFSTPVFTIKQVEKNLNVSYTAAKNNISKLCQTGKVFSDDKKRNKLFFFTDLLDILEN